MTALCARRPARAVGLLRPIDGVARTGAYQLVFGAGQFAVARWAGPDPDCGAWVVSSGRELDFQPESYRP